MLTNKQSSRSLVSFLVAWSFLVLTVTGLVLYVVPHGRVAYWVHWSLAGMEKEQWGWVHMMFGGVFIVSGVLHLYFNWKPFKAFLAARVKGHLQLKREVIIATAFTVVVFFVSAANLPPASWVIDLNNDIKAAWVTSPELEPPFGHAESVSLGALARRMNLDLNKATAALRDHGLAFEGKRNTLEEIARANDMTPMAVYAIIRPFSKTADLNEDASLSAEAIEAKLAGTGLGRKTLGQICRELDIDEQLGLTRLKQAGIEAHADDKTKPLADLHALTPIDLVKLMLAIEPE